MYMYGSRAGTARAGSVRTSRSRLELALFVLILASGCGWREELQLARLDVNHTSWDVAEVDVGFASRSALGPARAIEGRDLILRLFDRNYELIFEGPGPVLTIPDARLGDRERLVLEACGTVETARICDQRVLEASPKRIRFKEEVDYPERGRYDRGSYDFAFAVERQEFGSEAWEEIAGVVGPAAYLIAMVEGRPETSVRVPLAGSRGQFDLSRHENYTEFEYRVLHGLERGRPVPVQLRLFAAIDEQPEELAVVDRVVEERTRDQRRHEVERLVREAATRLLAFFEPYDNARAHVRGWSFDEHARRYEIRLSLVWVSSRFARGIVEGDLEVGENGLGAIFVRRGMNRDVRRFWYERLGGDYVELGTLNAGSGPTVPAGENVVAHRL